MERPRRALLPLGLLVLLAGQQGCGPGPGREETDVTSQPLTFLALGDSYTIGESVDSVLRWPVQLVAALGERGISLEEPVIVARTGWTTDELAAGIQEAGLTGPFGLVSLLIGVNNQYRGRDVEEYRAQFHDLLGQAIAFAGDDAGKVFVLSIPDWGVMPFAEGRARDQIAEEIDAFNRVNREETEGAGVRYVDVTRISREAESRRELVAGDGLHPSGAMYGLWVEAALPVVQDILGGSGSLR